MKGLRYLPLLLVPLGFLGYRTVVAARQPSWNVVLISIDTLRADHLSAYGYRRPTSPEIDKLAARGILFEQAQSNAPKTAPSHMTLLTGVLPDAHGVSNLEKEGNTALPADIPTLASLLRAQGYQTAAVTAGGQIAAELGFDRGQNSFEQRDGPQAIFARAEERIQELSGTPTPFCMFVHTYAVHDPYIPPEPYASLWTDPSYRGRIVNGSAALLEAAGQDWTAQHDVYWQRVDPQSAADVAELEARYDGSIRLVDELVGHLLGRLQELGELDRTVVVFVGDHGEEFREHGGFLHETVYQELLHVPLVVALPPGASDGDLAELRGKRVSNVVSLVDVLPTLLDLLHVERPKHLQGRSLLPVALGAEVDEKAALSAWSRAGLYALRRGPWKLVFHSQPAVEAELVKDRVLAWRAPPGTVIDGQELYDLSADPGETKNLAAQSPAICGELRQEIVRLVATSRAMFEHSAGKGAPVEVSEPLRRQLESLGYMGSETDEH